MEITAREAVERARDDVLANPDEYDYHDYRRCAVGHVYKAVTGGYAGTTFQVTEPQDKEFRGVMMAINEALGSSEMYIVKPLSDLAGFGGSSAAGPMRAIESYDRVLAGMDAHEAALKA